MRERERVRLRGNLRAVFVFSFVSLALVNGWMQKRPQPGALGSVVTVAAATGPMTGVSTLTNSPSEPHFEGVSSRLEVQRQVDEISAAQCRKRELAETICSSKSATCEEPTARLQSAKSCSGDTFWCQCPRYVVDKAFVHWHAVAHRDENARAERRCDVPVRSDHARLDERRKRSGDVGTRRVHAVCEWYGRYCVVSLFCETVAKFRIGDAHSRKQEVDWSHSSHWCFSVSSLLSLHANAERRECAWTETRAPGTWSRAAVKVETKRRPRDPGR